MRELDFANERQEDMQFAIGHATRHGYRPHRVFTRRVFVVRHVIHGNMGFDGAQLSGFDKLETAIVYAARARTDDMYSLGSKYNIFIRELFDGEIPAFIKMVK